jgi:ubiquitin-like modifier-activating enzyme ATG7
MAKKKHPLILREFCITIPCTPPKKHLIKTPHSLSSLNLKEFLSKENLIEEQSNLNIKLMKWRLEPSLQLIPIQNLKVLLVGSGTLGCNMGRLLSAWGIRKLGFIDYGTVSYSNLTRQSLFTLNDFNVKGEGLSKAEAAVKNMKLLIPTIDAKAYKFKIPMPGHTCSEAMLDEELKNLETLETLIKEYDVVFNVLDSREARYFPTLLSGIYNKLCISVGLGYDNFVIVKHGYRDFKQLLKTGIKAK